MRRLAAPLVLGTMLNPVNSSMLAVALIPIGIAFGASPATTVWLVSSLYVTTAVGQPVVGQLVDRFGARPLYLAGAALVGAAGLLGAFAPSLAWLVVARVLIGLGTSAGYPAAMRLLRDRGGENRGMLTALAVSGQVVAVVGPTVGGLLIGLGGWRAIFTVNVPFALACLVLGWRFLPRDRGEPGRSAMDLAGMALFAATLVTLLMFLLEPARWYLAAAGVAAAGAFTWRELRSPAPFLDLRVLAGNRPLLLTYGRQFLSYTVAYSFTYGYVQWLEEGRGLTASQAGLLMLPTSLVGIGLATLAGKYGRVWVMLLAGAGAQLFAGGALQLLGDHAPVWELVVVAVLAGVPQGLIGLGNQNALYRQADRDRMGTAAGLLRTFTYLGAMASSAAVAATFTHGAVISGMHHLSVVMVACTVLLLAVTLADRALRKD